MNYSFLGLTIGLSLYANALRAEVPDCKSNGGPDNLWSLTVNIDESSDKPSLLTTLKLVSTLGFNVKDRFMIDPGAEAESASASEKAQVNTAYAVSTPQTETSDLRTLSFDLTFDGRKFKKGPQDPAVLSLRDEVLNALAALPGNSLECPPLAAPGMGILN